MRTLTLWKAYVKARNRLRALILVEQGWYSHSSDYHAAIRQVNKLETEITRRLEAKAEPE